MKYFQWKLYKILTIQFYTILSVKFYEILSIKLYKILSIKLYKILSIKLYKILSIKLYKILPIKLYKILPIKLYKILSIKLYKILSIKLFKQNVKKNLPFKLTQVRVVNKCNTIPTWADYLHERANGRTRSELIKIHAMYCCIEYHGIKLFNIVFIFWFLCLERGFRITLKVSCEIKIIIIFIESKTKLFNV